MRSFIAALIISILILVQPAPVYYVAPYGVSTAAGDADSPKTLAWALASAPSGSTVWIIPGTYAGAFTASAPGVTYRSLPGTRARLDGNVTINAADVTLRDLEITNTSWLTRTGTPTQSTTVVQSFAPRTTLINNWIHDLGQGVGAFNGPGGATADLSLRGNLIYNNGWQGHGHGLYLQNDDAGRKTIAGNIIGFQYGYGLHVYGSSTAAIRHFDIDGNVLRGPWLAGGAALSDIHATNNRLLGVKMQFGYGGPINKDVWIQNNIVAANSLQIANTQTMTVTGNTIHSQVTYQPTIPVTATWDANTYQATSFDIPGEGFRNLANWRVRTGFDANSTAVSAPTDAVFITPNADDTQRGLITIYNWTGAITTSVSLASLPLTPGASYKLVNAANPAESLAFVAGAAPVSIPTGGWSVAKPIGASAPLKAWDSRFLVFLVEPL